MGLSSLRLACRTLRRSPGFTIPALLTLALGIGANTAMFSVIDALMLRPLPFRDPDRLAHIWTAVPDEPRLRGMKLPVSADLIGRWGELSRSFQSIAGYSRSRVSVSAQGQPERRNAVLVTGDLFRTLGYSPFLGRAFTPAEVKPGGSHVALLGYDYWQSRFGGDRSVLGRKISLDGDSHTIIGVMPPSASPVLPDCWRDVDIWATASLDFRVRLHRAASANAVARLKPGVSLAQADAEMQSLGQEMGRTTRTGKKYSVHAGPLRADIGTDLRTAALVLFGAAGCVLLIATVNIANLLLARGAARQRETGIRAVLGAGRWRLMRQMLVESAVVGLAGAAAGLLLSHWILKGVLALWEAPNGIVEATLDVRILLFALAASSITALLFGFIPALQASRPDLGSVIRDAGFQGRRHRGAFAPGNVLVVVEVALAVVLMVGAGLLIRTFASMRAITPGFATERMLIVPLQLVGSRYEKPAAAGAFARSLLERLQAHPQIESAGFTNTVPLHGMFVVSATYKIVGRPAAEDEQFAEIRVATPGFYHALGMPLVAGRFPADGEKDVMLLNQAAARVIFGSSNPIGQKVATMNCEQCTVIGVVGNIISYGLTEPPKTEFYMQMDKLLGNHLDLVVRTRSDPMPVVAAIRAALREADPYLAPDPIITMEEALSGNTSKQRFYAALLGAFAGVATLLAFVGVFGVVSYSVTQRTKEFGVRMALGAQRGSVLAMVVRQGLVYAGAGVALGLAGAYAAARVLASMLYGVTQHDAATFSAAGVLALLVAAAAAWAPARRATRVDPLAALRHE